LAAGALGGAGGRNRLSKAGNARLRKALYLPTLTAIRFNPLLKALCERLVAAGKARMAVVGPACGSC
jgi:transposase